LARRAVRYNDYIAIHEGDVLDQPTLKIVKVDVDNALAANNDHVRVR
jgi:hypothetical protein